MRQTKLSGLYQYMTGLCGKIIVRAEIFIGLIKYTGAKGLGQTGGAVTSGTTLDLFSATRGKDLSRLTNQQVGDLGEDISYCATA